MNVGHTLKRLARYILTGGTAALLELALFMALIPVLKSVPVAAVISILIAFVANYFLAKQFAFQVKGSRGRASLFFLGASVGLIINTAVTTQVVELELAPAAYAKLCGTGIAFVFNFMFNNFVVFSEPSS